MAECCDCAADSLACGDWQESVVGSAWSIFGAMHSDWLGCKVSKVAVTAHGMLIGAAGEGLPADQDDDSQMAVAVQC